MTKRKNDPEKEPNHERWLVSYADFITLLFAVFVTLYAMGEVDKKKAEEVIQSVNRAFGITGFMPSGTNLIPSDSLHVLPLLSLDGAGQSQGKTHADMNALLKIKQLLEKELENVGEENETHLDVTPRGLVIVLQDNHFFASGQDDLRPEVYPLLDHIARVLAPYVNPLSIEGFTDNTAIHSQQFASNWELSSSRALRVLHYLVNRHNFDPARLSVTGYGANFPIGNNSTEEGRRLNRRVEIAILAAPNASAPL